MKLYEWQDQALNHRDNDHDLWCAEAGTGKTFTGNLWLEQKDRMRNPVIFGPKQIRGKWGEMKPGVRYITPQTILKEELPENPSAILIDEIDCFASTLFVGKKRSQCAERLYNYIRKYPDAHVLGMTATPVRSTPWNMHTILTYIGRYIDWKEYRSKYFELKTAHWLPRPAYMPLVGWQKMMQPLIEKHAVVALMKDMVDVLPSETYNVINLKSPKYERNEEWEASKQFSEDHRLEQHTKGAEIERLARGYRKVAVVVYFTEQVDDLYKKLSKERETFVLDGRTRDSHETVALAEDSPECYFIIQSQVGAGFDLHTFACMIFASRKYSVRDYIQMKPRIRRVESLKPVVYYELHGGRCDKLIYKSIQEGKDFVPSEYLQVYETSE
jgi:superfamily II DNA or RNA helicase